MSWKNRLYESLRGPRYGGNPFSPKKSHVHGGSTPATIMSTERDESGQLWVLRKNKDGDVISRTKAKKDYKAKK